jgi:membrane protein DedA with SNARE-associated domain
MHQTLEFLLRHGYWVLFAWVLAEQLGLPVPSLPILLAMGALIGVRHASPAAPIGIAFLAAIAADSGWYLLGRKKGTSVLTLLCRISLEPDSCVSNTRAWFKKLGGWALVIAKFVPGLGTIAPPMAGLSRMPAWKFLSTDGIGVLLWVSVYMGLGYIFREQLEDVGQVAFHTGGWLLAVVSALLGGWISWKYWQRERFIRSLRIARVTPEEVFERLSDYVILDLRSSTEVEFDGMKLPGALWFDRKDLEQRHDEIPRDRDILLYCT